MKHGNEAQAAQRRIQGAVAMAALAGDRTLAELASEFGVHPTMISSWKQELVKNAKELFERGNKKGGDPQAALSSGAGGIGGKLFSQPISASPG